jgi:diguanylate cyclase (GGDEF)-like protein/PAS domain S-box-containing protein
MTKREIVLIIGDRVPNKEAMNMISNDNLKIVMAKNNQEAVDNITHFFSSLINIIIDDANPLANQAKVFDFYRSSSEFKMIPLIVISGDESEKTEKECLDYGAWDFIKRSTPDSIIEKRIKSVMQHSDLVMADKLHYLTHYDPVSGIYNKPSFFEATKVLLSSHPDENFAIFCIDIEKFHLINAFFGIEEGDKLIKHIAQILLDKSKKTPDFTYGHIEADVFVCCLPYKKLSEVDDFALDLNEKIKSFPITFDISPAIGIVIVKDREITINSYYDRAKVAGDTCKNNIRRFYAYYEETMGIEQIREQNIANSMSEALAKKEFTIFLQPKYNLMTNQAEGAEVLARWIKDGKIIPPKDFIPVFERNGFIMQLDYYVWESSCKLLRRWINQGKHVFPISVNISRVNLYDPQLPDRIIGLIKKYDLPPALLQLELTESAYVNIPVSMRQSLERFHEAGFTLLMDDFGSGYSSLNLLKDINFDILKIDMKFLSECEKPGRGENILDSVLRLAKWLDLPVIAEGVESQDQVRFLRNIGCQYVQGYFFAKPMPVDQFESTIAFPSEEMKENQKKKQKEEKSDISADSLWSATSQLETLFSNVLQPYVLYEFNGEDIEILRVNDAYNKLFGYKDISSARSFFIEETVPEDRGKIFQGFSEATTSQSSSEFTYRRIKEDGALVWISMKLKYLKTIGKENILFGALTDITTQTKIEEELQKVRSALSYSAAEGKPKMLIVDDEEINRTILANLFSHEYEVSQASDGKKALEEIKDNKIDIVLLDLVMPIMSGTEALKKIRADGNMKNLPVVIITADNSPEMQTKALELGASDYIVKPFVPAVVVRRVNNVRDSSFALLSKELIK